MRVALKGLVKALKSNARTVAGFSPVLPQSPVVKKPISQRFFSGSSALLKTRQHELQLHEISKAPDADNISFLISQAKEQFRVRSRRSLSIINATIDDKSAENIAKFIRENPQIKSLDLSDSKITRAGLSVIVQALENNIFIKNLGLSNAVIMSLDGSNLGGVFEDEEALRIMAKSLKNNSSITGFGMRASFPRKAEDDNFKEIFEQIMPRNQRARSAITSCAEMVFGSRIALLLSRDLESDVRSILLERIREEMIDMALQTLFDGCEPKEVLEFSEKFGQALFRSKFYQIKDHKDSSWLSLFGEKEITIEGFPDYKLVARTNSSELKEEGREMGNCIGELSEYCIKMNRHIISIVGKDGRPISDILFKDDAGKRTIEELSHLSHDNLRPPEIARNICAEFKNQVAEGRIEIDFEGLELAKKERAEKSDKFDHLAHQLGFDGRDLGRRRKISKFFREICSDELSKNLDEFLNGAVSFRIVGCPGESGLPPLIPEREKKQPKIISLEEERLRREENKKKFPQILSKIEKLLCDLSSDLDDRIGFEVVDFRGSKGVVKRLVLGFEKEETLKKLKEIPALAGNDKIIKFEEGFFVAVSLKKLAEALEKFVTKGRPSSAVGCSDVGTLAASADNVIFR